jgi:hypothetical protein
VQVLVVTRRLLFNRDYFLGSRVKAGTALAKLKTQRSLVNHKDRRTIASNLTVVDLAGMTSRSDTSALYR